MVEQHTQFAPKRATKRITIREWGGFGEEGEELVHYMHGEAAKIDKVWEHEYRISYGNPLGFKNYKRAVGKIGFYCQDVVRTAWDWARSDEPFLRAAGTKIFVHHYLNTAVSAIELLQDEYGKVLDKDELIGRANEEILETLLRTIKEDSPPTKATARHIHQRGKFTGSTMIGDKWSIPVHLICKSAILPVLKEVAQLGVDGLQDISKRYKFGLPRLISLISPTPRLVLEEDARGINRISEVRTYPNPQTLYPDDLLIKAETIKELIEIVNSLNPRDREVVKMRNGIGEDGVYGLVSEAPLTLEEIAGQFGLTRERIRQLEESKYRRIKESYRGKNPTPQPEVKQQPVSIIPKLMNDLSECESESSRRLLRTAEEELRQQVAQKYGAEMLLSLLRASENGRLSFDNFPEFNDLKQIRDLRASTFRELLKKFTDLR